MYFDIHDSSMMKHGEGVIKQPQTPKIPSLFSAPMALAFFTGVLLAPGVVIAQETEQSVDSTNRKPFPTPIINCNDPARAFIEHGSCGRPVEEGGSSGETIYYEIPPQDQTSTTDADGSFELPSDIPLAPWTVLQ